MSIITHLGHPHEQLLSAIVKPWRKQSFSTSLQVRITGGRASENSDTSKTISGGGAQASVGFASFPGDSNV